jgi:hypothetical protein
LHGRTHSLRIRHCLEALFQAGLAWPTLGGESRRQGASLLCCRNTRERKDEKRGKHPAHVSPPMDRRYGKDSMADVQEE